MNSEKIVGRTCENLGSRSVMLDNPATSVDSENKRPHRRVRFHVRRRCLSAYPLAGCHGRLLKKFVHGVLTLIMGQPSAELRALPILPFSPVCPNMPYLTGDCSRFRGHAALPLSKFSLKSYWLRVVLLAEAGMTTPWLVAVGVPTTRPAGSFGMSITWSGIVPAPPSSEAMP